jgi:hypothetical protein
VKLKKLCVMALCTFLLTLAFAGVGKSAPEEMQSVYDETYGGLRLVVIAPVEAYPGENITVTVKTNASDVQQIYIDYINLKFRGAVNTTAIVTFEQITHLDDVFVSSNETRYNITIPDNISPGLIFGEISCEWKALGTSFQIPSSGFALTYIKHVALEQLQAEYDELNATHHSMLQNYTEMESTYNEMQSGLKEEVDSTRSLMYIFVATTVVASITVVVLLLRKPKKVWL